VEATALSTRRIRLDERLVADGLVDSRSIAQRLIMAGEVRVNGAPATKAGTAVRDDDEITLIARPRFVSRGGDKLEHALVDFADAMRTHNFVIAGTSAIDIGASTGGFTDCLLQRDAARVIAVDVGYGQLDSRLRADDRVHVMERTNARHLTADALPWEPELLVCDASFISLVTLLPAVIDCMAPDWWGVLLCKPQFEAGKERMNRHGSGGVLRDDAVRTTVVAETIAGLEGIGVATLEQVEASPRGPKGNVEFALLVQGIPASDSPAPLVV
jgi:23S rRNA (cytidine1920-2'-O)/16S rRNA (cytidine1409-2'-O)-methyltransferase